MPTLSDVKKLLEDLKSDGESFFGSGRLNNVLDITLSVTTVFASVAAACLAAAKVDHPWLTACVAAIPAATISIQTKVGIRERSDWYFQYAAEVRALATELEFAEPGNVRDYAKRRAKLEIIMEAKWPSVGRHQPSHFKGSRSVGMTDDDE